MIKNYSFCLLSLQKLQFSIDIILKYSFENMQINLKLILDLFIYFFKEKYILRQKWRSKTAYIQAENTIFLKQIKATIHAKNFHSVPEEFNSV